MSEAGPSEDQKRPILLVVDDDPGDILLLQETCRELDLDFRFEVCRDGEEAWRFLTRGPGFESAPRPDLVLLDLNLPKRTGRELFAQIREHDGLRKVPVVVLTTSKTDADVVAGADPAFNLYLTKPMRLDGFLDAVRRIHRFFLDAPKP